MTKKEADDLQRELYHEILAVGVNVVTCGNCGSTLFHRCGDEIITCPDCLFSDEPSNFPDLIY